GRIVPLPEERDGAAERGGGRSFRDRGGITPAADDEEARVRKLWPHEPDRFEERVEPLLPGEAAESPDRERIGPEPERGTGGGFPDARSVEDAEVDALPEDVHLLRRSEALLEVPARGAVRDDEARVDVPPREAVEPAPVRQLVRRPQEQHDAAPRAAGAPEGRHARRLLRLREDEVGSLRTHRRPDPEHARGPGAVDIGADAYACTPCCLEPRGTRPSDEHSRVPPRREARGRVDHPALHAAVDRTLVG